MAELISPNAVHCLVYASRMTADTGADLDQQIHQILRSSIRNNRACSVTGLLIAHQGWFIQALEGPPASVRETFDRIKGDGRHSDCLILRQGGAEKRLFPRWSMCARAMSGEDDAILDILDRSPDFDPRALGPAKALDLLLAVAEAHDQVLTQQHSVFLGERVKAA